MKCLVTGVAGFVGSHLAERLLVDGNRVVGVDAITEAYDPAFKARNVRKLRGREKFRMVRGDLVHLDLEPFLHGTDVVFHLAAQAGVRSSWGKDFNLYLQRNVLATQRLLEACKEASLRRFVYASSSSVYGDITEYPTTEKVNPHPLSPYGVTKLAAEHLCNLYFRNHGIPVISLRYFTVYGPRQRPDMAFHRFLRALHFEEPIVLYGDGRQSRDFTFVSDIIEANIRAVEVGEAGGVYNIGGGSYANLLEVLEILEAVTGRKPQLRRQEAQKGDVKRTWADLSRAKKDLNYRPEVDLWEGIAQEYVWLKGILGPTDEIHGLEEGQKGGEMALPTDLLEILACPKCVREPGCTGELEYREAANQLVCHHCQLVYRIEDDIPVMLIDEATPLKE